jgi:predicted Zn-dependent protease
MRPIVFVPLALCLSVSAVRAQTPMESWLTNLGLVIHPDVAGADIIDIEVVHSRMKPSTKSASKKIKQKTAPSNKHGKQGTSTKSATAKPMKPAGKNGQGSKANARDDHAGHAHGAVPKGAESAVDALWRQADEAFHAGDYEKSIALHKKIVALDPHDSQSYGVAAWLTWSLGRGDEAIAHLRRGVAGDPKNWKMWDELGQNCSLQKRWRDSQDAYTHAVALISAKEDSQMLRRRLAHAAEKAGDLRASIATWRALAKQFPTEAVNRNNLARVEAALANPPSPDKAAASINTPREGEGAPLLLAGGGLLAALLVPLLVRR